MAWKDRTITLTVEDWGPYVDADNDYSDYQQKLTLTASTDSSTGKLNWTLTASNNYSGGVATCIYLKIGGTEIYNTYWSYANRGDRAWNSYPTGDGSASGTIDIGTSSTSTSSFAISLKLCCAQDARSNTSRFKTTSGTLTRTWWTDVGTGTVSITDNGNNTFTLKGTKGANGTNNTATGPTLSWGYSNQYGSTFTNNDTKDLDIIDATQATRTVYAKSVTGATYGDSKTKTTYLAIKQYVAPSIPKSAPIITYTKTRLTIKENWKISWGASTATNSSSPVTGYRFRLFVNGNTIPFKNGNGTIITTDGGAGAGRYYRDYTTTSFTFYPEKNDIKPGDRIKLSVFPYTTDAVGNKYFGTGLIMGDYIVQNAGIMRVKVGGIWREGQVYVKAGGVWKEADCVYTKVNGAWKESV